MTHLVFGPINISKLTKEAQMSLTNHPTDAYAHRCCAIKSCPLVNDCDLLAGFSDSVIHQRAALDSILAWFSNFYRALSHLMPSVRGSSGAIGFVFEMGKLEQLGYNLCRLGTIHQRVQNNAAWIVLEAPRRSHVRPLLRTLHWLPVQQRIDYKVALLTFKVCNTSTP